MTASMYAVYHGPEGLRQIATRTHRYAAVLAHALAEGGFPPAHERFFDTLTVPVPGRAADVVSAARSLGVHLRLVDADTVALATSECTTRSTVATVLKAFGIEGTDIDGVDRTTSDALPPELRRTTDFLDHPVFNTHHNETSMLRYLHRLSSRDYALDRGMIPLGSCTMKLNATTEMEPISLHGFADLHPFVPAEHAGGYRQLVYQLEGWLAEVTGYDRCRSSRTPGRRASSRGCSPSGPTTMRRVIMLAASA